MPSWTYALPNIDVTSAAWELRLFEDFDIGDKVTSVDVEKSAGTALMEALDESRVASIDDPRLRVIWLSGQYDGSVHADFGSFPQVLVVPYTPVQSAKSSVCPDQHDLSISSYRS